MTQAKRAIDASFTLPTKFPTFCHGTVPVRSILLWGPPGTGKTLLAKSFHAAMKDAEGRETMRWQSIEPGNILSKWVGESAARLKEMFENAKQNPTILFMDEIDAFARSRSEGEDSHVREFKTQLMQCIQSFVDDTKGAKSLLFACTNTVTELDDAIRRRFTTKIYCDLPTQEEKAQLLEMSLPEEERHDRLTPEEMYRIAGELPLFSGSDLVNLVQSLRKTPMLELQRATHFRLTTEGKWEPTTAETKGAVAKTLSELKHDSLAPRRRLKVEDFHSSFSSVKPTLSRQKYEKFQLELAKVGGGLSQQADEVDTCLGVDQRTEVEREIDFIMYGVNMKEPTVDIRAVMSTAELGSTLIAHQLIRFEQLTSFSKSSAQKVRARVRNLVMMGLVGAAAIHKYTYLLWVMMAVLSLLVLFNNLFLPVVLALKNLSEDEKTAHIDSEMSTEVQVAFVFFLVSVLLCSMKAVSICSIWFVDALLVSWILMMMYAKLLVVFAYLSYAFLNSSVRRRREQLSGKVRQAELDATGALLFAGTTAEENTEENTTRRRRASNFNSLFNAE
eukprot:gb/GEZN01004670.1/.p1 GENE.gb/GEZN01004670.1/~~gb/GEZN01004670.1/.p1  ORF type:complete len:589 (+),score=74.34 gb/GEZN01004670.1/:89-1768(+)